MDIQYLIVLTNIILCRIQWLKTILKLVPKIVMLHARTWKLSFIIQTHNGRRASGPQNFSYGHLSSGLWKLMVFGIYPRPPRACPDGEKPWFIFSGFLFCEQGNLVRTSSNKERIHQQKQSVQSVFRVVNRQKFRAPSALSEPGAY